MASLLLSKSMLGKLSELDSSGGAASPITDATAAQYAPLLMADGAAVASRKKSTIRKPVKLSIPVVDVDLYLHRRNGSSEALGKFTRRTLFGYTFYYTLDSLIGVIPMGITSVLILFNMALVWHQIGWREYIFTLFVLFATYMSYFLVTSTDPGIYPRLKPGETDPLGTDMQLVYCRVCELRRPPRASHCYQCDVCILEHDHHCSVLGGCVGVRNLRWFTLYLITCCSSTMIGVVWLTRYLLYDLFTPDLSTSTTTTTTTSVRPEALMGRNWRSHGSPESGAHLLAIFILLLDCFVVLLVGAMAFIYMYLTLTATTRRESRRKQHSLKAFCQPALVWGNMKKAVFPPPSMLIEDPQSLAQEEELAQVV